MREQLNLLKKYIIKQSINPDSKVEANQPQTENYSNEALKISELSKEVVSSRNPDSNEKIEMQDVEAVEEIEEFEELEEI